MGREVVRCALEKGCFACAVDKNTEGELAYPVYSSLTQFDGAADVLIDFSHYLATPAVLEYAVSRSMPAVIATTGQTEAELAAISAAAEKIPVFRSANMSLGVALLIRLAKLTAATMKNADIEIVEIHHNQKTGSPSGTALRSQTDKAGTSGASQQYRSKRIG